MTEKTTTTKKDMLRYIEEMLGSEFDGDATFLRSLYEELYLEGYLRFDGETFELRIEADAWDKVLDTIISEVFFNK